MEFVTNAAVVLAMVLLGALVIHLARQTERIAGRDYARYRPRLRRAGKETGTRTRPSWTGPLSRRRSSRADRDSAPSALLLADTGSRPIAPGTALLRLETTPDSNAWDNAPRRLVIEGRVVGIDRSPVGDNTVIVTRWAADHFSFLLVPPHADAPSAHAAVTMAMRGDHTDSATQILAAADIARR